MPGDTTSLVPGYPIRTSSDPRSVDNSPRHIAASHVLHRLPVPRHPPCALKHLQHKKPIVKKQNCTSDTKKPTPPTRAACAHRCLDARNHYPQIKHHTPPPKPGATTRQPRPQARNNGPVVSKPNSVSGDFPDRNPEKLNPLAAPRLLCTQPAPLQQRVPSRQRLGPSATTLFRGAP